MQHPVVQLTSPLPFSRPADMPPPPPVDGDWVSYLDGGCKGGLGLNGLKRLEACLVVGVEGVGIGSLGTHQAGDAVHKTQVPEGRQGRQGGVREDRV
jgi:hypothetical protein